MTVNSIMKAIFIGVENSQLKFEIIEVKTDALAIHRPYVPPLNYAKTLPHPSRPQGRPIERRIDTLRFNRHDFVFCDQTHRIYIWDMLQPDHDELQKGLREFLVRHFPLTTDHEKT